MIDEDEGDASDGTIPCADAAGGDIAIVAAVEAREGEEKRDEEEGEGEAREDCEEEEG